MTNVFCSYGDFWSSTLETQPITPPSEIWAAAFFTTVSSEKSKRSFPAPHDRARVPGEAHA
jgi:hypothetical protein